MTGLAELSKQLTPEILQQASSLFGVRQDWLECVSDKIYNVPDFYKHPEKFDQYITELSKQPMSCGAMCLEHMSLRTQLSGRPFTHWLLEKPCRFCSKLWLAD
ncbi:MAG: hypothetical protein CVV11_00805 [Gammaproteobacteria bacterium HGW-Gammaproteobacteria-15]|nr:MAG: hypothetical protein CVV11_00805 [Gammaproteobacteria bacterium HGW-Gammaproteobacteria-15]